MKTIVTSVCGQYEMIASNCVYIRKFETGDSVKWKRKAEVRIVDWQKYKHGIGPKPHSFTGTIIGNAPTKQDYTFGYFRVEFPNGIERVFGEDLEIANEQV
tara:strand:+ start:279 stop:581 length:303 start_codon:yes stop_codon:yes gene_type:complete